MHTNIVLRKTGMFQLSNQIVDILLRGSNKDDALDKVEWILPWDKVLDRLKEIHLSLQHLRLGKNQRSDADLVVKVKQRTRGEEKVKVSLSS